MASGRSTSEDFSDILFHHKAITGREVGVVYIVYNDYHTNKDLVLRGLEADCVNIERFFDACDDEYYMVPKRSVTAKRLLTTCEYLANYTGRYLPCCDRIIIYFAGHGGDNYIRLDEDCSDVKKGNEGGKKSEAKREKESKVDVEDILAVFRNKGITEKMSIILLLDACCNAKTVKCEKNELVASAASEKSKALSNWYGGYWTNVLYTVFNATNERYNIIDLLKDVEERIKDMFYNKNGEVIELYPTFQQELKREICFKKSM